MNEHPTLKLQEVEARPVEIETTPAIGEFTFQIAPEPELTTGEAIRLYEPGLHVAPTPQGSKTPYPGYRWGLLFGTRLDVKALQECFEGFTNIALFVGRHSKNLTALDCDSMETARAQEAEFKRRGLRPWVSKGRRGLTFVFLSADGELKNITNKNTGLDWQLWGCKHHVMVYPSIHPDGGQYVWQYRRGDLPPTFSIAQLDWLPLELSAKPKREFVPFESANDEEIKGTPEGTRNDTVYQDARILKYRGKSEQEAQQQITPAFERAGLGRKEINKAIRSAYKRPSGIKQPVQIKTPFWVKVLAWSNEHAWQPMPYKIERWIGAKERRRLILSSAGAVTAQSAKAIFDACVERQRRDASSIFRASVREVAEIAQTRAITATRGLHALMAAGWLGQREEESSGAMCYAFTGELRRLVADWYTKRSARVLVYQSSTSGNEPDLLSDVFRPKAMGRAGLRVWRAILKEPMNITQAARAAKCSRRAASRTLYRMSKETVGLVTKPAKRGGKWFGNPVSDVRLMGIAADCGTIDKTAKQRRTHATERAVHATGQLLNAKRKWDKEHRIAN